MTAGALPPLVSPIDRAVRSVNRAAGAARLSGLTMLILGGISLAISIPAPLSPSFAISLAIVIHGWIEVRLGRRLKALDPRAPVRLGWNQLAVGVEIAAYAWWQSRAFGPEQIDAVLQRPLLAGLLDAFPPEVVEQLLERLPGTIAVLYGLVGAAAFAGCAVTAWYYVSRSRLLRVISTASAPPRLSPSP